MATSRNDDHGGDVLRRTQSFVNGLVRQCERHGLEGELVLVDWNPPKNRAPLQDVLDWPSGGKYFAAKVVTVPRELALTLPNARALSMFQMIAKNVGLRRASGDYVVATNIDIIFSDELFAKLAEGRFDDNALYRSDRWDIPNEIQLEPDFDRLLARARQETIRRNLRDGTYTIVNGKWSAPPSERVEQLLVGPLRHHLQIIKSLAAENKPVDEEIDFILSKILPRCHKLYLAPSGHFNGCGDFTMLSRAGWEKVRGYPEWPIFSWNIDSVMIVQAALLGLAQVDFPAEAVHYHIEHDYGSGYTPGGMGALLRRLHQREIPLLDWQQYQQLVVNMADRAASGGALDFNDKYWGFATRDLPIATMSGPVQLCRPAAAPNSGALDEGFAKDGLAELRLDVIDAEVAGTPTFGWLDGRLAVATRRDVAAFEPIVAWQIPENIRAPFWIRCHVKLEEGAIALGALTGDHAGKLAPAVRHFAPEDGGREVVLRVGEGIDARAVVLCALESGRTSVTASDVELFFEPDPSAAVGVTEGLRTFLDGREDNPILLAPPDVTTIHLRWSSLTMPPNGIDLRPLLSRKDRIYERDFVTVIGASAPVGHALYGPYIDLSAGTYEVVVDAKYDGPDDEICLALEASLGPDRLLASVEYLGLGLRRGPVAMTFTVPEGAAGQLVETRISHFGKADIGVASVRLLRA